MYVRTIVLAALLCLPFAGLADEPKAKTDVVKVETVRWSPTTEKYEPYAAVTLLVSRGKKGVVANRRAKDATFTTTDDDGKATLEFDSGSPITLVSHRGKDKMIPEVLSLASRGGDAHEVVIALIAAKDYPEFQKKNPGAAPAHQKVKQAYNATPAEVFKTPEGKQMQKEFADLYRETRPTSTVLVPAYFQRPASWTLLAASASKHPMASITAVVKLENARQIAILQKSGVLVIGFVDAGNGARGKEASAEIKRWYQTQPTLDGIFVDRQPAGEKDVAFNAGLAKQIRAEAAAGKRRPTPVIVGNCGGDFPPSLLDDDINSATCCFLGNKVATPEDIVVPDWLEIASPERAAVLISNLKRQEDMERFVRQLVGRQVGYCYFTDRALDPFGDLPTLAYWDRMLELVSQSNMRGVDSSVEKSLGQFVNAPKEVKTHATQLKFTLDWNAKGVAGTSVFAFVHPDAAPDQWWPQQARPLPPRSTSFVVSLGPGKGKLEAPEVFKVMLVAVKPGKIKGIAPLTLAEFEALEPLILASVEITRKE